MKGLCPFHDEKTPSFQVTPARGFFYCFGCGEGGDVITFLQKIDNLSFAEAVERLADRVGVQLRYTDDGGARPEPGRRMRLMEAHQAATEFYVEPTRESGGDQRSPVPLRARVRPGRRRAVRRRLRTAGRQGAAPASERTRVRRLRAGGRRSAAGVGLGLFPGPAALADPRLGTAGGRLRRPPAARRRPDAGQVPQHAGNRPVQEVPRPVRTRSGSAADRSQVSGRGGGGLHRRDGGAPRRGRHRGRVLRDGLRGRARPAAAPADGRP